MTQTLSEAVELPPTALAFSEARARYQSVVFAFVAHRVRPLEEAEDVVAATFVDAYRHWHRRKGDPRLWLLGIARRKVADSLRDASRNGRSGRRTPPPTPSETSSSAPRPTRRPRSSPAFRLTSATRF